MIVPSSDFAVAEPFLEVPQHRHERAVVPSLGRTVERKEIRQGRRVLGVGGPVPEGHVGAERAHVLRQIEIGLRRHALDQRWIVAADFVRRQARLPGDVGQRERARRAHRVRSAPAAWTRSDREQSTMLPNTISE